MISICNLHRKNCFVTGQRCWIETCQLEEGCLIFNVVISPKAVFSEGQGTMYKTHLRKFDVLFRKLLRGFVGPTAGTAWSRPWHEILHDGKRARKKMVGSMNLWPFMAARYGQNDAFSNIRS